MPIYLKLSSYYREDKINYLIESKKYDECMKYLDRLIAKEPNNYKYYGHKGFILVKLDKNKEGLKLLQRADKLHPDDDVVLNNISWAYCKLDNYKEALIYSEKSLKIAPNDPITLSNKGNALHSLGKNKEAVKAYEKALKSDPEVTQALFGIGLIGFETQDYKKAVNYFTKYNTINPNEYDVNMYLAKSYYYCDDYKNAIRTFNRVIALKSDEGDAYIYKGLSYNGLGKYDSAITAYKELMKKDPKNSESYYQTGISLNYSKKFKESNEYFNKAASFDKEDPYPYIWMAKNYGELGDLKAALKMCDVGLSLDPENGMGLKTKAELYMNFKEFDNALVEANKGIKKAPDYMDLYVVKSFIFIKKKEYKACIGFIKTLKPEYQRDEDILWNEADCYSNLGKHDIALNLYKKALLFYPKDELLMADIGWENYYLHNLDEAKKYGDEVVKINKKNSDVLELLRLVKYDRFTENEKIIDFVKTNYLYYNTINDFPKLSEDFKNKKKITDADVLKFLEYVVSEKDYFTYFIYGKSYDEFIKSEGAVELVTKKIDANTNYLSFSNFTEGIGEKVEQYLRNLHSTEKKNLVIDLRNNTGGLMNEANKIIDLLLPKCTMSYLMYRDGNKMNYYSDSDQIKFRKIIILVNENSASSSEILTLSLKKHLNNVVVIGHKTYGKGVGQLTYENKKLRHIILLTNFYWYVEKVNVLKNKITPDIIVNGSQNRNYFSVLKKVI